MAPTTSGQRQSTMNGTASSNELIDAFSVFDMGSKKRTIVADTAQSLRGFDPMLEMCESRDDQLQQWPDTAIDLDLTLASSSSESTAIDGQDSSGHHQVPKRVSSTELSELRDIAAEIGRARPRALTREEENEITLGNTTKSSGVKSERNLLQAANNTLRRASAAPSTPVWSKKKDGGAKSSGIVLTTTTTTPSPKERRKSLRRAISAKISSRSSKTTKQQPSPTSTLTMSLEQNTGSPKSTPKSRLSPMKRRHGASLTGMAELTIPSLSRHNPTSFLRDSSTLALKTSEQDPSPHQVALPTSQELLVHSKLCALLDSYDKIDDDFNFNDFKGVKLQFLSRAASDDTRSIPGMTPTHRVMMNHLLECSQDIMVEGFVTHGQGKDQSRVGIFSMQSSGRVIVAYRGTTEQQLKPARTKSFAVNLDPDHAVSIYAPIRDAYFPIMEKPVYKLLDTLMEDNPFNVVTFVGHSFGGALATIAAVRFATARPMQCFSCQTFGSPKVGAHDFRTMVNSLPNLNIMRVEYGSDGNTNTPADVGPLKWEHVGHTIAIHSRTAAPGPGVGSSSTGGGSSNSKNNTMVVLAYRFDKNKPSPAPSLSLPLSPSPSLLFSTSSLSSSSSKSIAVKRSTSNSSFLSNRLRIVGGGSSTNKASNSIHNYVAALEPFAMQQQQQQQYPLPWITSFVGEEGQGVCGTNNETRSVV